jgi:hypothetical protein
MPLYRMIIHGRGKFVLREDEDGYIHITDGFYTTRWCRAASKERATERGMALLRKEWTTGRSAHLNQGAPLSLEIDKIWRIALFDIWRAPNRGHTFYNDTDHDGSKKDAENSS